MFCFCVQTSYTVAYCESGKVITKETSWPIPKKKDQKDEQNKST